MTKYAVLTDTFVTGWVNTWTDDDGHPLVFDTLKEAQQEIDLYLSEARQAYKDGHLEDYYNPEDYKIVEITENA